MVFDMTIFRRSVLAFALVLALGACESLTSPDSLIGSLWEGAEAPPLPGERISVLMREGVLKADPNLSAEEILLPPPTINPEWPQTGGYANHAMHHIKVAGNLSLAWNIDVGEAADDEELFVGTPVVAAGRVFVMDVLTTVSSYDAKTGDKYWEVALTPDEEDDGHIGGGVAYDDGRLFVAAGFGQIIALNATTGAVLWRKTVESPLRAAPTVRGGRVFVLSVDNKLHVFAAHNGKHLWVYDGIAEVASMLGGGSPAVDGGVVVVPYSSGELVALRVDNGRQLWTESLAMARQTEEMTTLSHIRGSPVIDRGRVFAMSNGGVLVSIDLRSGRRIWTKEVGGLQSPWGAGDYLFILTNDSEIAAVSRDFGRIHWVRPLPRFEDEEDKEGPIVWSGPVLVSDRLIIAGSHGEVVAISPYTGQFMGKVEIPDGISVPPIVANGSLFFLSDDAELFAYR